MTTGGHPVGEHCPIDLWKRGEWEPYVYVLDLGTDKQGYPRGHRINGFYQCPRCGAWWPIVEEPEEWVRYADGRREIESWWGAAICTECNLLMVEQPDGADECYRLEPRG